MKIFLPNLPDAESYLIKTENDKLELCELGLPVPPVDLRLGSVKKLENYLNWAKPQIAIMLKAVEKSGLYLSGGKRILDFGCGAGRMIRWLKPLAETNEIWGTDINSEHIYWATKYLKPFHFTTNTTIPHLPFEDGYFDFIYAGSVFTHIDDLAMPWLLELRRITSRDCRLYLTIHDERSIELLNDDSRPDWKNSFLSKKIHSDPLFVDNEGKFDMYTIMRGPDSQVFYRREYFLELVSPLFRVVEVMPEAYGFQTAVVLKK